MQVVWYVAAALFGLGLGLHFGRLFAAILAFWESATASTKAMQGAVLFLLGGAGGIGGTVLFGLILEHSGAAYLCGLGIGLVVAFFLPCLPSRYSRQSVETVVRMSEALREEVPDPDQRALLILTTLVPAKSIRKEGRMGEAELARELEAATDRLSAPEDEAGDKV